jgi:uncharacterized protein YjgD (DUF1641 family)
MVIKMNEKSSALMRRPALDMINPLRHMSKVAGKKTVGLFTKMEVTNNMKTMMNIYLRA